MIDQYIYALANYGVKKGLIGKEDKPWAVNRLLQALELSAIGPEEAAGEDLPLEDILPPLLDDAEARGIIPGGVVSRDLLDTKLMGELTPRPSQVIAAFREKYDRSPEEATDWFYGLCQDADYIRRYRIAKDMKWVTSTEYGDLDITINLSKPEKDPKAIAAAKAAPQSGYPKCQLCRENEGYAGRVDHPARQNHRVIPVTIDGKDWFFQYSPYVYYNEHCIVFNGQHTPMKIERATFRKLLDFVKLFPHYFVGSNADLPIVGGSILTHDHFQGGHYEFPMAKAPVREKVDFPGFEDVEAGIVHWPMSVIRLRGKEPSRLVDLADKVLTAWREYSDESADILAYTDGTPHNTITPIARRRGEDYELDLVLRNNRTTQEHPLGLFHPHAEYHHIKKENIGLIEVMGLAILPPRLLTETQLLEQALKEPQKAAEIMARPEMEKHQAWYEELKAAGAGEGDTQRAIQESIGVIFGKILGNAGVYKDTEEGREAFRRFCKSL